GLPAAQRGLARWHRPHGPARGPVAGAHRGHGRVMAGIPGPALPSLLCEIVESPIGRDDHRSVRIVAGNPRDVASGRDGRFAMNLIAVGCNFRSAPVEIRERLAFDNAKSDRALDELIARYDCEAVVVSTCNRVELYLARPQGNAALSTELVAEFLAEFHGLRANEVRAHVSQMTNADAVRHLFRVAGGLDSMVVGEAQIAGQLKRAYERARARSASGPLLNALFQHAFSVAKRVRSETGIGQGRVSVSTVAVDYVKEVFTRFDDETGLVIGAGKMGALTMRHLKGLNPQRILVTNRSPEKAEQMAKECGGTAMSWGQLDEACAQADIILSTTGALEPIMPRWRWDAILAK